MVRRIALCVLLALLFASQAAGQRVTKVPETGKAATATEQITLEVGQKHIFDFQQLTKPFAVEAEAVFSVEEPDVYRDLTGKALVVFGSSTGPDKVLVRLIQENKTTYRALVTINTKPQPPAPSPYIARLTAAYAKDTGATALDLAALGKTFEELTLFTATAPTGKAVWDKLTALYGPAPAASLKETRREIAIILGETTTELYNATLDAKDRRAYLTVLKGILDAIKTLQAGPPPTPVPITTGPLYIVVVKEASKQTPEEAALYNSQKLADYIKQKGHSWLVVDQDITGADKVPERLKPYLDRAKGKTLPFAIIVDKKTGKEIMKETVPLNDDEAIKLLQKAGG